MLTWSIIFFVIALVSGLLGFTGVAGASSQVAKLLFKIAFVVFLISCTLAFFI